jgi:ParB/RepB/Spo0J family partition protein
MNTAELMELPVKDVIPTPDNHRKAPQPGDPDIRDLASSIEAHGLLHPVVVRKHPAKKGKYDLRCGARRLAAHQRLKAKTILAVVREMTDEQAIEATALENLQRVDLTPLEEGRSIKMLLRSSGDPAAVAAHIGRSVSWVYRRAALADLESHWAELFETPASTICGWSSAHLELLARLDHVVQTKLFLDMRPETQENYRGISASDFSRLLAVHFTTLEKAPASFLTMEPRCKNCEYNSASQPDLFEDAGERATCHSPECFERKQHEWMRAEYERAVQKHGDRLVVVTSGYQTMNTDYLPEETSVIPRWQYQMSDDLDKPEYKRLIRPAFCVVEDGEFSPCVSVVLDADTKTAERAEEDGEDGDGSSTGSKTGDQPASYRDTRHIEQSREIAREIADAIEPRDFRADSKGNSFMVVALGFIIREKLSCQGLEGGVESPRIMEAIGIDPDDDDSIPGDPYMIIARLMEYVEKQVKGGRDEFAVVDELFCDYIKAEIISDLRSLYTFINSSGLKELILLLDTLETMGLVKPDFAAAQNLRINEIRQTLK